MPGAILAICGSHRHVEPCGQYLIHTHIVAAPWPQVFIWPQCDAVGKTLVKFNISRYILQQGLTKEAYVSVTIV